MVNFVAISVHVKMFSQLPRLDELVDFQTPGLEERERMVRLYFDKFVLRAATEGRKSRRIKIDNFDFGAKCSEIAARLEGLSGREISKLGAAWQVSSSS